MKSSHRRIRRPSFRDAANPQLENRRETFFGSDTPEPFFKPAVIQRAEDPAHKEEKKEDEKVHRAAVPKDKEETLMRAAEPEKKEEEKVHRAPDAKEKEDEKVHRKSSGDTVAEGSDASRYIRSLDGKGSPLPDADQAFFGERMGADFRGVRVHTGGEAEESARDVSARAYTVGNHIVFNEGQYSPGSGQGRRLLAHELTHVVQQGSAPAHGRSPGHPGAVQGRAGRSVQRGFWSWVGGKASWVGDKISDGAHAVGRGAKAVGHGIAKVAGWGYDVLQSAGAWVWDLATWAPSRVWALLKHAGSGIVGLMSHLWSGITGGLGHVWDGLKAAFSWAAEGVEGLFGWVWSGLRGAGNWAFRLLHGDFSAFWSGIGGAFSWLGAGAAAFLDWGWKGLEGLVVWGWKGLRGLGAWIWEGIKSGAAWTGRLLAKLLDLIGAGEAWTFLMNILKGFSTRPMNGVELAEAAKVYAGSLHYWQIRIDEYSLIAKIGAWFQGAAGMGVTTAQTINFNRPIAAAPGNGDMGWLVHELGHVAQYTHVGLQYLGEAIHAQATTGYSYGGGAGLVGKKLSDFNREQQADILSDFYKHVLYGSSPYATEYTALRDQAIRGEF